MREGGSCVLDPGAGWCAQPGRAACLHVAVLCSRAAAGLRALAAKPGGGWGGEEEPVRAAGTLLPLLLLPTAPPATGLRAAAAAASCSRSTAWSCRAAASSSAAAARARSSPGVGARRPAVSPDARLLPARLLWPRAPPVVRGRPPSPAPESSSFDDWLARHSARAARCAARYSARRESAAAAAAASAWCAASRSAAAAASRCARHAASAARVVGLTGGGAGPPPGRSSAAVAAAAAAARALAASSARAARSRLNSASAARLTLCAWSHQPCQSRCAVTSSSLQAGSGGRRGDARARQAAAVNPRPPVALPARGQCKCRAAQESVQLAWPREVLGRAREQSGDGCGATTALGRREAGVEGSGRDLHS